MTDGLSPAVDHGRDVQDTRLAISPRTAGRSLYASLLAMVLSTVAIALFFGGAGEIFGPINDLLVVATVLLLLPAIFVVRQLVAGTVGGWFSVLTGAAIVGVLIMAAGQLALVAGIIDLETSFLTGTIGVLMAIAWVAGLAAVSLRSGVLARAVGWWAAAFVAAVVLTSVAIPLVSMDTATLSLVFGGPLLVTLVGWMVSLARDLEREAATRA